MDGQTGPTGRQGPTGHQGPTGVQGRTGPTGLMGNTILTSGGAPSSGLGRPGDYYIDINSYDLYGPKLSSDWPAAYPMQGATGPTGPATQWWQSVSNVTLYDNYMIPNPDPNVFNYGRPFQDGQVITWRLTQNHNGGHAITFDTQFVLPF
jgi:hypothetical protein